MLIDKCRQVNQLIKTGFPVFFPLQETKRFINWQNVANLTERGKYANSQTIY